MRNGIPILLGLGAVLVATTGRGDEWPQFRGPGGTGLSAEKDLPKDWGPDKNVQWKVPAHGRGWSSPIVWGDKVFLTAAFSEKEPAPKAGAFGMPGFGGGRGPGGPPGRGGSPGGGRPGGGGPLGGGFGRGGYDPKPPDAVYRFEVYCLDRATGKELWKQVALESKPRIATHQSNTYASETPVTDGERVYAYFGMHGVYCYDMGGKLLWKKDLGSYPMMMGWGTGSSPALDGERLFLQVDNESESFVVALDKKTGDEVWRAKRPEQRSSWCSPLIWKNKERTELVTASPQKVRSYNPANGTILWELTLGGGQGNASPIGDDDRLYVGVSGFPGGGGPPPGFRAPGPPGGQGAPPSQGGAPPGGPGGTPGGQRRGPGGFGGPGGGFGGPGGLFAVKAGASGDITPKQGESSSAGVAWSVQRIGPQMASPLAYQGYVYVVEQNGMLSCIDAKTGKPAYTKERIPNARQFWASPWAYDGRVFCLDDGGTTHIIQAGPEFKVLGKNKLDDQFWATTAIAHGALILRGVENVYCIKP